MLAHRRSISTVFTIAAAALSIVVVGCSSGGKRHSSQTEHPSGASFRGAALPSGVRAPEFRLSDQRGRAITLSSLRGRVVVLAFLTSDCRACTLMAQQVRGALDELGSRAADTQAIFMSTDPSADTPPRMERFLDASSLDGRALFLHGPLVSLQPIWRAYDIPMQGASSAEPATIVLLIDPDGNERVEFGLEQLTPEALSHDIGLLIP